MVDPDWWRTAEPGLPEVANLPVHALQDPVWERTGHTVKGRDGCRVPVLWRRSGSSFGFGSNGAWLPQPADFGDYSVEAQDGVADSAVEWIEVPAPDALPSGGPTAGSA